MIANPQRANPTPQIKFKLNKDDIDMYTKNDIVQIFKTSAEKIDGLEMFHKFCKYGWSPKLAKQTKKILLPALTYTVTIVWYKALMEAKV
jgi:hypothetical protein